MHRARHTRLAGRRARLLRNAMTASEARLWNGIRRGAVGARFRRQVPIGPYIADFASYDPRLVVEVDGPEHDHEPPDRTDYLNGVGFAVLRLDNAEIARDVDGAIRTVENVVRYLRETGESFNWL